MAGMLQNGLGVLCTLRTHTSASCDPAQHVYTHARESGKASTYAEREREMYTEESVDGGISRQIKPLDSASASLLKWHSCLGNPRGLVPCVCIRGDDN